jgi:hypothetical protein
MGAAVLPGKDLVADTEYTNFLTIILEDPLPFVRYFFETSYEYFLHVALQRGKFASMASGIQR